MCASLTGSLGAERRLTVPCCVCAAAAGRAWEGARKAGLRAVGDPAVAHLIGAPTLGTFSSPTARARARIPVSQLLTNTTAPCVFWVACSRKRPRAVVQGPHWGRGQGRGNGLDCPDWRPNLSLLSSHVVMHTYNCSEVNTKHGPKPASRPRPYMHAGRNAPQQVKQGFLYKSVGMLQQLHPTSCDHGLAGGHRAVQESSHSHSGT